MKRFICILLVLAMVLPLFGCKNNSIVEPVSFYYLRKDDTFGTDDSIFSDEVVDGSKYAHISLLLSAYLKGPQNPSLESPFPAGTYPLNVQINGNNVTVTLSKEFATLTGVSLSLASCALAKTVIEYAGVESVQIQTLSTPLDGDACIVIHRNDILLYDQFSTEATDIIE